MTNSILRLELNASLVHPMAVIYVGGRFVCDGEVTDEGFINCYPPSGGLSGPLARVETGNNAAEYRDWVLPGYHVVTEPAYNAMNETYPRYYTR